MKLSKSVLKSETKKEKHNKETKNFYQNDKGNW